MIAGLRGRELNPRPTEYEERGEVSVLRGRKEMGRKNAVKTAGKRQITKKMDRQRNKNGNIMKGCEHGVLNETRYTQNGNHTYRRLGAGIAAPEAGPPQHTGSEQVRGISWPVERLSASEGGLCCTDFVKWLRGCKHSAE
jgi:hypothetical protein